MSILPRIDTRIDGAGHPCPRMIRNTDSRQSPRLETVSVVDPPKRQGGGKVESVDELVSKLKEAGVI
jgi:electron transfer flavoprotein alpha/beta subunit